MTRLLLFNFAPFTCMLDAHGKSLFSIALSASLGSKLDSWSSTTPSQSAIQMP